MFGDYKSLFLVLVIVVLLYLPTLLYPIDGDSISYARVAKSYIDGNTPIDYFGSSALDAKRLPLFPLSSVPFALLTGSFTLGLRISAFVFGIISIIVWFFIGKERFKDKKIFPFLILCPVLITYVMFRGLSEAPLICFSLLSLLFFFRAQTNKRYYYLSGIFFVLATLSNYIGIFIGVSYILIYLLRKKMPEKELLIPLIAGFFVFSLMLALSMISGGATLYLNKLGGGPSGPFIRLMSVVSAQLPNIALFILLSIPLMPFFIKGFLKSYRKRRYELIVLFLVSFVIGIISGSAFRYLMITAILFLMISFEGFLSSKHEWKKLFMFGIILYVLMLPCFVNGNAKEAADMVYMGPVTWGQAGFRQANAIAWINQNLPEEVTLLVPYEHVDNPMWSEYMRPDINTASYVYIGNIQDSFYMIYNQNSDIIFSSLCVDIDNSVVRCTDDDAIQPFKNYVNTLNHTIVFQEGGFPVISVHMIEK